MRLNDFDLVIVNDSGGKDGQSALRRTCQQAADEGFDLSRLVVQYNRLGKRVSWPGTAEMGPTAGLLVARYGDRPGTEGTAHAHAERYGLRFEVTEREHEQDRDLLDQIDRYGKFPSDNRRFCTSDSKRAPGKKLVTREVRQLGVRGRPARMLYVFGFRSQESSRRGKLPVLRVDEKNSSRTGRSPSGTRCTTGPKTRCGRASTTAANPTAGRTTPGCPDPLTGLRRGTGFVRFRYTERSRRRRGRELTAPRLLRQPSGLVSPDEMLNE
ncbi:hypothetical protein ACQSSU_20380 [Micromonospora echinospora]